MAVPLELLDCFEILGVSPGAHPGEIRSAFRRLALSFHPDVVGPQGACRFEAIAAAYSVLKSASPVEIADALKKGRKAPGTPPGKDRGGSPFRWRRKKQAPPSPSEKKKEEEEGSGRVRELLLERALVEAELSVARLLEKAGEGENDGDVSRVVRRLLGAHPEVRLLALRSLGRKAAEGEVFAALLEMVRLWPVDEAVLERLLLPDYSPECRRKMAEALVARFSSLPEGPALAFLRWISPLPGREGFLGKALSHQSPRVLAAALSLWTGGGLPDDLALLRLLKRDEDCVLIPLLRVLKVRGVPPWAVPRLTALSEKHPSPAVRVWARSIVRAENLV